MRGFGYALTAVCPQCFSVLDVSTPEIKLLQQIEEKYRRTPKIPLGTRGKMSGAQWEVIGFQTRTIEDDGETFSWDEYLLFNPFKGFRYLTEYDGHWNFVKPMEEMPHRVALGGRPGVIFEGRRFRHFSGAEAATTFVLGEFPWRVKTGDKVIDDDFVDPPTVLSAETTDDEVTWSRGEYVAGAEIWKAFALTGNAPAARGVYLNQPSPYVGGMWGSFALMCAILVVLAVFFASFSGNNTVFKQSYQFETGDTHEPSFVTPVFDLKGRTAALELTVHTNLVNDWAYFNFALINEDSGTAFDFGREVSYYAGTDSDGPWTEGSETSTAYIPAVPPGHYYLRVEPEMEASEGAKLVRAANGHVTRVNAMAYSIELKHDVPNYSLFWIAGLLLAIPPIFYTMRARSFEVRRWMQSDYPPIKQGGD